MPELVFEIHPDEIPLGVVAKATLVISHTARQDLVNIRGCLSYPTSLTLLGLDEIEIDRIDVGEARQCPVKIASTQPGKIGIHLTRLNAKTSGGVPLHFVDRDLEIIVSDRLGENPNVSVFLEPMGSMIQNVMGRLKCRIHNNGHFPLTLPAITMFSKHCEIYMGPKSSTNEILPGSGIQMEVQVLPKLAGEISILTYFSFKLREQSFPQKTEHIIRVVPSSLPLPSLRETPRTILVISSSPRDEELLRTDKEIKEILFEMKRNAPLREQFQVEVLPAATADELTREIIVQHPYILHFAGHGTESSILVENMDEEREEFPGQALVALLQPLANEIECVILNSCKSIGTARELSQFIRFVVGMQQVITDTAALTFSRSFYQAIGAGLSIEQAFKLGKASLVKDQFTESFVPVLFKASKNM